MSRLDVNQEILTERIKELIEFSELSPRKFSIEADLDPSNFSRKLKRTLPWTSQDIKKITLRFNVRKGWLKDGEGQMFNAPDEMKEAPQAGKPEDVLLEVHASCIRRLEDERTRVIEELKEIRELRDALKQELKEIKSLKDVLVEAARALNHKDNTHVASGPR